MKFETVTEFTDYLYHLPKLHEKSDLRYVKRILAALGHPESEVKCCHITGTNGKGSTAYYLSNLLQKAGQRTGLFVSPFIVSFNERIQLNGQPISDQELLAIANQVEDKIAEIQKTEPDFSLVTFEYEVAMAFLYFAKQKCDYAVIEVGIGAEHDKTNVITPAVSLITTIGLDHEQIIGPTLADIAREKSGIIKKQVPAVLGDIPESVKGIVEDKLEKENSQGYWLGKDFSVMEKDQQTEISLPQKYLLPAMPEAEGKDAAMALKAFSCLGLTLAPGDAEAAITETTVPGRYQKLGEAPMLLLDGAHNVQAGENLLRYADQLAGQKGGQVLVLTAMMKDKDLSDFLSLFQAKNLLLTSLPYPRAAKQADFPAWAQEKFPYEADLKIALDQQLQQAKKNDIVLVTGSFYLVSAVLQLVKKNRQTK